MITIVIINYSIWRFVSFRIFDSKAMSKLISEECKVTVEFDRSWKKSLSPMWLSQWNNLQFIWNVTHFTHYGKCTWRLLVSSTKWV